MRCLVAIVLFAVTACSNQNIPTPEEPLVKMGIHVVKFESPEYLDYVIAGRCDYKDSLFSILGCGFTAQDLYIGSSPYIALSDDYYAIDWKWGSFIYGAYYLLNIKWEDVKDRHLQWTGDKVVLSSGFIKEMHGGTYEEIDQFLNIAPPPVMDESSYYPREYLRPGLSNLPLSSFADSTQQRIIVETKYQDSIHAIYVERISRIIEEGRMKELKNYTVF